MNAHINVRKNYIEYKRQIMLEIVYIIHVCLYIMPGVVAMQQSRVWFKNIWIII